MTQCWVTSIRSAARISLNRRVLRHSDVRPSTGRTVHLGPRTANPVPTQRFPRQVEDHQRSGEPRDFEPGSDLVRGQVDVDPEGYLLVAGRTTGTSVEGGFACGDLVDHTYRQAAAVQRPATAHHPGTPVLPVSRPPVGMDSAALGPVRIHYRSYGADAPLRLIQALMTTSYSWPYIPEGLGARRRLIIPDLPGAGRSRGRPDRCLPTHLTMH
jgi:hypothetical protein